VRASSDRRMVTCVFNPVASSTISPTPERFSREKGAAGSISISTSRSLSGRASPRALEPKMASFVTPSPRNAGAVSRTFAMISSRVILISRNSLRRLPSVAEAAVELTHQFLGGLGDDGAGRKDRLGAGLAHGVVILRRDDTSDHDHDVGAA